MKWWKRKPTRYIAWCNDCTWLREDESESLLELRIDHHRFAHLRGGGRVPLTCGPIKILEPVTVTAP